MKRIEYKKYAGFRIKGDVEMEHPTLDVSLHLDRAIWLASMVESGGVFGTVMNYDGTGMTASIDQCIAVYPRALDDGKKSNDQGPLWGVLAALQATGWSMEHLRTIEMALHYRGRYLSQDGALRDEKTGGLISGKLIREEFTGDANGCMPIKGEGRKRALEWVRRFHHLFSMPATHNTQLHYAQRHMIKRAERQKLNCKNSRFYKKTLDQVIYAPQTISSAKMDKNSLSPPLDLAMCVWWSHLVNAPAIAMKKICSTLDRFGPSASKASGDFKLQERQFSHALLKSLANSNYGRWNDEIKNGRWQRTRNAAMKLWPEDLFERGGCMPKKVLG